jgi:hypothetical protein
MSLGLAASDANNSGVILNTGGDINAPADHKEIFFRNFLLSILELSSLVF